MNGQSGMFYVEIVELRGSSIILMDTRDIIYSNKAWILLGELPGYWHEQREG